MTSRVRDPLTALEVALEQQRASILSGAFDTLGEIEAAIQSAMSGLSAAAIAGANMDRLAAIKARAAHQGRLLQAALRGVQDARDARQSGKGFTSYDRQGRAGQIGTPRPRFERRS